ncbi:unnamed protein product [Phytophthora lilii]|uniref:Sugar transporter SWEET1 n=1 Tax=Phytophthora lilii TaxID=2077276 RepID=A0A9W7CNJ0_9STRA|nr:unnamed protein product [Phytophthora lilii]
MGRVIRTKSAASLPIELCVANLVSGALWSTMAIGQGDMFVLAPNALGMMLSVVQVALYLAYPPPPEETAGVLRPERARPLPVITSASKPDELSIKITVQGPAFLPEASSLTPLVGPSRRGEARSLLPGGYGSQGVEVAAADRSLGSSGRSASFAIDARARRRQRRGDRHDHRAAVFAVPGLPADPHAKVHGRGARAAGAHAGCQLLHVGGLRLPERHLLSRHVHQRLRGAHVAGLHLGLLPVERRPPRAAQDGRHRRRVDSSRAALRRALQDGRHPHLGQRTGEDPRVHRSGHQRRPLRVPASDDEAGAADQVGCLPPRHHVLCEPRQRIALGAIWHPRQRHVRADPQRDGRGAEHHPSGARHSSRVDAGDVVVDAKCDAVMLPPVMDGMPNDVVKSPVYEAIQSPV